MDSNNFDSTLTKRWFFCKYQKTKNGPYFQFWTDSLDKRSGRVTTGNCYLPDRDTLPPKTFLVGTSVANFFPCHVPYFIDENRNDSKR